MSLWLWFVWFGLVWNLAPLNLLVNQQSSFPLSIHWIHINTYHYRQLFLGVCRYASFLDSHFLWGRWMTSPGPSRKTCRSDVGWMTRSWSSVCFHFGRPSPHVNTEHIHSSLGRVEAFFEALLRKCLHSFRSAIESIFSGVQHWHPDTNSGLLRTLRFASDSELFKSQGCNPIWADSNWAATDRKRCKPCESLVNWKRMWIPWQFENWRFLLV